MAILERFLAVVMVLLLVGCSSVPVGAASSSTGSADELNELIPHGLILDRAVPVYGMDGQPYAVLTNATQPDEWYSEGWVNPYDTVTVVHSPDLAPKGLVQVYITQPSSSWPLPGAQAVIPVIGAAAVVGYTTLTGTEIVVLTSGALMVGGATYDIKTNPARYEEFTRQLANAATTLTSVTTTALHDACRHLIEFPARVQQDIQNENDYNDAKNEGRPTNNYNPDLYKKKDPNSGDTIVDHQSVPQHYKPYRCIVLYYNEIDRGNGCPKQVRYYDRNGNTDIDIDIWHNPEQGGTTFPHKHIWLGYHRSEAITGGLEKVLDYWKCKYYDYDTHQFFKDELR